MKLSQICRSALLPSYHYHTTIMIYRDSLTKERDSFAFFKKRHIVMLNFHVFILHRDSEPCLSFYFPYKSVSDVQKIIFQQFKNRKKSEQAARRRLSPDDETSFQLTPRPHSCFRLVSHALFARVGPAGGGSGSGKTRALSQA